MDRATTISWGASLQQLDDMMDTGNGAQQMTDKAENLRASLYEEFAKQEKIDMQTMRAKVLAWYSAISNCAFAPLQDPDPLAAGAQRLFQGLGQLRGLHKNLQQAKEHHQQKCTNANVAMARASEKVLSSKAGALAPEEVRAAVEARLAGWVQQQVKGSADALDEAQGQVNKVEQAMDKDVEIFVMTLHWDYQTSQGKVCDPEDMMQMMLQDVEQQLLNLDLGSLALGTGETGGTAEPKENVANNVPRPDGTQIKISFVTQPLSVPYSPLYMIR